MPVRYTSSDHATAKCGSGVRAPSRSQTVRCAMTRRRKPASLSPAPPRTQGPWATAPRRYWAVGCCTRKASRGRARGPHSLLRPPSPPSRVSGVVFVFGRLRLVLTLLGVCRAAVQKETPPQATSVQPVAATSPGPTTSASPSSSRPQCYSPPAPCSAARLSPPQTPTPTHTHTHNPTTIPS